MSGAKLHDDSLLDGEPHRRPAPLRRPPPPRGSAQRERLPGERRQHLRGDPDGRRRVAHRVAVAPVGPPEPGEVPERRLARALAGAEQRLDRPAPSTARPTRGPSSARSRRPGSGTCAARRAPGASARRPTPAARSASIAAAVSFESGRPPLDHEKPPPFACAARIACTSACGGCSPAARSAITVQIVSLTSMSGRWRRKPREDRRRRSSRRGPRARRPAVRGRRRSRASASARAEELGRARPLGRGAACRDEAERGPGGQRRVGSASLLGEAAARGSDGPRGTRPSRRPGRCAAAAAPRARPPASADREPPHAHTTSVWTLRPWRSSTRRSSGPGDEREHEVPERVRDVERDPGGEHGHERRPGVG